MVAPSRTIETDRLSLRPHRRDDLADCAALWRDPVVARYIGGKPSTEEESWGRLLRYVGHWEIMGFGYWTVRDRATGGYVGEVGFADFKREITPSFDGAPEAGWVLMPGAHGRGLATEAVRAAIAWLERERGPGRTVCIIYPDNAPSIRVAAKCGYREWTRTTYKETPSILYER